MTDKGAGPLLKETPVVVIEGVKYPLRRLGLLDVQRLARIVAKVMAAQGRNVVANVGKLSTEEIGTFIVDLIPDALDDVLDFMADLLGFERGVAAEKVIKENEGTIRDPNIFPLGSEVKVVEAIAAHQDVVAFFDSVKAMSKNPALKKLTARLSAPSTPSKKDTGGRTKKS